MCEKEGHLRPNVYQLYIAAKLCARIESGSKRIVFTLGAGQGKTVIYLVTAMLLLKHDETKNEFTNFAILTSNAFLKAQL